VRRLFALVATIVLVDTMFFAALTPLLPHYADELDLTKSAAGILGGAYAAGALFGSLPGGWLTGRVGVRRTVLFGLALMGGSSLAFAFGTNVAVLDVARFIQGVGGACMWSGGLAWLIAVSPRERRGELIGSALAAAIGGVLLGPVLGGAATVLSPEAVFSSVAVMAIALAVWALSLPVPPTPEPTSRAALSRAMRSGTLAMGIWFVIMPALFAGTFDVLAPLRLGVLGASGVVIGAIFLVAAGVESVMSRFAGAFSDRRGRLSPIRAGLVSLAIVSPLLAAPNEVALLTLVVMAASVAMAFFWAPATALLSDAAEAAGLEQGIAFAVVNFAWASGQLLGGAGGASLADATADVVPYLVISAAALMSLGLLGLRGRDPLPSGRHPIEWRESRRTAD
jgi:MFS family permease